jgi:hypothetical protein
MSSISNHLNGKTKSKKTGRGGVLIEEKNVVMIAWTSIMGECGLSINLQQLKTKVTKLTQTKVTPFRNGIAGDALPSP